MGRYSNPDIVPRLERVSLVRAVIGCPIDPSHRFAGGASFTIAR